MTRLRITSFILISALSFGFARTPPPPPVIPTTEMLETDYCYRNIVCFPRIQKVENYDLKLESVGIKASSYAVAFYSYQGPKTYDDSLSDVPRGITIRYMTPIRKSKLVKKYKKVFFKNKKNTDQILRAIFSDFLANLPDVRRGDVWEVIYEPPHGTFLKVNTEIRDRMPGADFARAYFDLWFGEKPINKKVQKELHQALFEVAEPDPIPS